MCSCPSAFVVAVLLMACGMPMTMDGQAHATTVEAGAMGNTDAARRSRKTSPAGPVAAIVAIKQIGTNGGGFFGSQLGPSVREPKCMEQSDRVRVHHHVADRRWSSCSARMLRTCRMPGVIYGVMLFCRSARSLGASIGTRRSPTPD